MNPSQSSVGFLSSRLYGLHKLIVRSSSFQKAAVLLEASTTTGKLPVGGLLDDLPGQTGNAILANLPEHSLRRLWPKLERIATKHSQVLSTAGSPVTHVYFVESGMISLVQTMQDGSCVEISAVGREGAFPLVPIFASQEAALDSVVQIPGSVLAIRREVLTKMLALDHHLHHMMRRYASAAIVRLAQMTACGILHSVEERYCRWLLAAHDNVDSNSFRLTHEVLGMLLGVRRASVSVVAEKFLRAGLILYKHGKISIIDRSGIEEFACECYETARQEFQALFTSHADW